MEVSNYDFSQIVDLSCVLTDQSENEYTSTFKGIAGKTKPFFSGVADYTLTNTAWSDNGSIFTATITFPFPVSKDGGTTNWTFVRSQGMSSGVPYIYVNNNGEIVSKSTVSNNGLYGYLPTEEEIKNWMWAIYPQFTDGNFTFQIKNAATNKYVPTATQQNTNISVSETAGNFSWGVCTNSRNGFYLSDNPNLFWGAASSDPGERAALIWNKSGNSHKGCNLEFPAPMYKANCNITDNAGGSYSSLAIINYTSDENDVERPSAIPGVLDAWITNVSWNEGVCNLAITFPFAVSSAEVANISLMSIGGDTRKWSARKGSNEEYYVHILNATPELATWQWAIYPQLVDGAFKFKIMNVATGKYVYAKPENTGAQPQPQGWVNDDRNSYAVILNDEGTAFAIEMANSNPRFTYQNRSNAKLYLTVNGSSSNDCPLGVWNNTHDYENVTFPILESYNISIGTSSYASAYTPIAVTIPNGVTVYTAKLTANKASIILNELTGVIPANTAFIVKGNASTTYTFNKSNTAGTPVANNVLMGSTNTVATSSINDGVVYTMQADGTFAKYTGETIPGCNAYIKMPAGTTNAVNILDEADFVNEVTDFKQGGVYTFVTPRGWVGANADSEVAIGTVKTTANPAASAENPNFLWTVYKSQKGNYYLYNIGKEKFLGAPSNDGFPFVDIPTSKALSFKISSNANYPIMFSTNNRHAVSQNANSGLFAWEAGWTNLNDDGSNHQVTLVSQLPAATLLEIAAIVDDFEFEGEPISGVEDFVNGGIYNFETVRGWMGATLNGTNVISTAKTSNGVTGRAKDPMFQWTVYKSTKGHYYLYNIGKKMFMGVESRNNTSVPFVEQPAGKKLTFKESASDEYPFMFSTDNAGVVNHSETYGEGLVTWTGGWDNLNDGGSNHKISYVGALAENELATISELVERYDQQLYVTYEVEGSWNDNPNTHFGNVTATSTSGTLSAKLKTDPSKVMLDYDGLNETTISFTRAYRGFKFQGFVFDGQELGESFKLTDELKSRITAETPLVAKFTCTDEVTLFYDDDPFPYRIPAIATTSTGRLIAVSDYRHCLDDIGMNRYGKGYRVDLVIRTSNDNGKTWSPIRTIAEGIDNSQDNDCAYGDAAIAVVGEEVVVMAVAGSVSYGNGSAGSETEPKKTNRLVRIYSANNGEDWIKEDITEQVYGYDGSLYPTIYTSFFGSGKLAVDPNIDGEGTARIYGPMLTQGMGNIVIYSDDMGLTWKKLGTGGQVANANEPKIEILPNGQLLFSARRNGGRNFNVFTYTDKANGKGSWSNAVNGCDNEGQNGTNGETFLIDAQNASGQPVKLLLQSQPVGGGAWDRENVSIWYKEISSDANHEHTPSEIAGGWTKGMQVSHQLSAYSTMSLQEDGRIAFFFEEAPCYQDEYKYGYSMVYIPLAIQEITNGKYADINAEPKSVNVVLTDAQGNSYNQSLNIFADDEEAIKELVKTTCSFAEFGANPVLTKDGNTYTYTNTITLPFKVSNNEGTYWHNIYYPTANGNNPIYWSANNEDDEYATKQKTDDVDYGASIYNTKANEKKIAWAIYSVNNSFTFKFKNKLTGKYVQVTSVAPNESSQQQNAKYVNVGDASIFEIVKDAGSRRGDYAIKSSVNSSDGYLCSTNASYDYLTHFNHSNHEGAWVKFVEAPDFDALIAEVNSVISVIGDGIGQYPAADQSKAEEVITAQAAMQSEDNVTLKNLNLYKTYGSYIEGAKLNLPKAGQFYRIKSCSNGKYLSNTVDTTIPKTIFTKDKEESDPSIIYYFEPGTGEGEYYLMSYANGHYLANPWRIGVGTEIIEKQEIYKQFTTITEGQRTKYVLKYANGSDNLITVSDAKTDYTTDKNLNDAQWTFEPVTELPLTIHSSGLSTYSAPVDLEIPDGVTAYYAKRNDGETIRMAPLADVIPANTGVIMEGTGTVSFPITTGAEALENNLLKPVVAAKAVTAENGNSVFILATPAGKETGFYPLSTTNNIIGGHKSYLEIPAPANPAARLSIVWDDTETGIFETEAGEQNAEIYDLTGRRLDKATKGINIIGGKLVIK